MTATFSPSLVNTRDTIRLELGDTDTTTAVLQDETIDALYTSYVGESTTVRRYQRTMLAAARATLAVLSRRPTEGRVEGAVQAKYGARVAQIEAIIRRYATLVGDPGAAVGYAAAGKLTYQGSLLTPYEEE